VANFPGGSDDLSRGGAIRLRFSPDEERRSALPFRNSVVIIRYAILLTIILYGLLPFWMSMQPRSANRKYGLSASLLSSALFGVISSASIRFSAFSNR